MMAITTSNSMSVKPFRNRSCLMTFAPHECNDDEVQPIAIHKVSCAISCQCTFLFAGNHSQQRGTVSHRPAQAADLPETELYLTTRFETQGKDKVESKSYVWPMQEKSREVKEN